MFEFEFERAEEEEPRAVSGSFVGAQKYGIQGRLT